MDHQNLIQLYNDLGPFHKGPNFERSVEVVLAMDLKGLSDQEIVDLLERVNE